MKICLFVRFCCCCCSVVVLLVFFFKTSLWLTVSRNLTWMESLSKPRYTTAGLIGFVDRIPRSVNAYVVTADFLMNGLRVSSMHTDSPQISFSVSPFYTLIHSPTRPKKKRKKKKHQLNRLPSDIQMFDWSSLLMSLNRLESSNCASHLHTCCE